jgi:CheY-like chemotaxis protein
MALILHKKRIFIVEDDLFNRSIMQTLLERQGAVIAFERWGADTVERLQAFSPVDIILMDLMFPNDVTGYDIFDKVRAHTEFDHIPIVAVSASDPSSEIPKVKSKGFAGFITKPVNFALFARQIADILEGKSIWNTR